MSEVAEGDGEGGASVAATASTAEGLLPGLESLSEAELRLALKDLACFWRKDDDMAKGGS